MLLDIGLLKIRVFYKESFTHFVLGGLEEKKVWGKAKQARGFL